MSSIKKKSPQFSTLAGNKKGFWKLNTPRKLYSKLTHYLFEPRHNDQTSYTLVAMVSDDLKLGTNASKINLILKCIRLSEKLQHFNENWTQ